MLEIRPCDYATARAFVSENHRHNTAPNGHKFSIACYDGDRLCGVCMVARPIARMLSDGFTLEVTRCCTDGTRNACTMLYGAACRAAKALGYKRIYTYTREYEPGTRLKASNWECDGTTSGHAWTSSRYDIVNAQTEMQLDGLPKRWDRTIPEKKIRWHKDLR